MNSKKKSRIIVSVIIIIIALIGIITISNIKKHICVVDDYLISKEKISKELENELYNKINSDDIKTDEKYLLLGYLELCKNENKELAKKYFELGIENINKYTCSLTKVYLYKFLSDIMLYENRIDEGIKYAEIAFLSINKNYYERYSKLIYNIIKPITATKDGRAVAVNYLNEILDSRRIKKESKLIFMKLLSAIHILNYDYAEAISLHIKIIRLDKSIGNKYYANKSIIDMSIIAREVNGYKTAIRILEEEINSEEIEDDVLRADIEIYRYINLAQVQNLLGMHKEALDSIDEISKYEKYIPESKKISIESLKNIIIAESYVNNYNIELAKEYLYKAKNYLELAKKTYPDIDIYYNIILGTISFKEGNYEEAIKIFEINLELLNHSSNKEYERICIAYLIKLYENIGDKQNVTKYINKSKNLKQEMSENFINNYYKYIVYKEDYKEINEKKEQQAYAIMILFIVMVPLILVVSNYIIYPYIKNRKDRRSIKSYLENNNYILNYQPIVNPINNKIMGFESLLRLKLKEDIIYPNILIPQIERADMMNEVSIWILKQIIMDYDEIRKIDNVRHDFYLSMNVSLKEIEDEKICNKYAEILRNSNINKKCICIEITENILGNDYKKIRKNIKSLMDSGFIIAIDDFGVDYSNLSFLEKLDFNIIKLDKYFIDNFSDSIIVKGLIDLLNYVSTQKDISIVVEGIEEKEQVDYIKEIKSDKFYIQGYYYSKPVEIEKLKEIQLKY